MSAAGDELIRLRRGVNRKPVRDERLHLNLARGQQVKKSFNVSPFGPTHIGHGIVVPAFLVVRIVTARPVRQRNFQS